jgi:hypothetical protein
MEERIIVDSRDQGKARQGKGSLGELWELQLPLLGKVIARKLFVRVLTNIEENDLDRGRDGHDYFGAIGPFTI